eukprot:779766-Rhodomonas_salina.1
MRCRIGGVSVVATAVSDHRVHCRSPAGSLGEQEVGLTAGEREWVSQNVVFEYVEDAEVHRIAPMSGSVKGGTTVEITGAGFVTGSACRFGDANSTRAEVVSSTTIMCTSPMVEAPGSV